MDAMVTGMNMESHGLAALGRDLQGVQQEAEQIAAAADAGSAQAGAHGFEQMLRRVDAQGHDAQARMQSVERGESESRSHHDDPEDRRGDEDAREKSTARPRRGGRDGAGSGVHRRHIRA